MPNQVIDWAIFSLAEIHFYYLKTILRNGPFSVYYRNHTTFTHHSIVKNNREPKGNPAKKEAIKGIKKH